MLCDTWEVSSCVGLCQALLTIGTWVMLGCVKLCQIVSGCVRLRQVFQVMSSCVGLYWVA